MILTAYRLGVRLLPNNVMIRKRLIDYLPPFMQDFAEIKAVMHTEQPELDQAWLDIQVPLADAFIMDCDEYGIKKYESFVGVNPDPQDTLDDRKARVLIYWNNFVPYTYRVLVRRLNELCGAGNYEIYGSLENYELFLKTSLMLGGQMQSLEHLLTQMVPMNMNCGANNEFRCETDGLMGCAGGVCAIEKIAITSDFKDGWDIDGMESVRGLVDNISGLQISSDFRGKWGIGGTESARGLVDNTAAVQVSNDQAVLHEASGNEKSAAFTVYATGNFNDPVSGQVSVEIVETTQRKNVRKNG